MINKVEIIGKVDELKTKILPSEETSIVITGEISKISDSYHSVDELYAHRILLFSILLSAYPDKAWKSKKHNDGEGYDGWFIAGIETPSGDISYHISDNYWDMLSHIKTLEVAPKWDGHTSEDVLKRLNSWALALSLENGR